MNTSKPAMYPRIVAMAPAFHCGDAMVVCPDCGCYVCVFCMDECSECFTSVF